MQHAHPSRPLEFVSEYLRNNERRFLGPLSVFASSSSSSSSFLFIFFFFFSLIENLLLSSRRGKSDSGDVDILMTHPDFDKDAKTDSLQIMYKVVTELKKRKYLIDELVFGVHQYMGICRLVWFDFFRFVFFFFFFFFISSSQVDYYLIYLFPSLSLCLLSFLSIFLLHFN